MRMKDHRLVYVSCRGEGAVMTGRRTTLHMLRILWLFKVHYIYNPAPVRKLIRFLYVVLVLSDSPE